MSGHSLARGRLSLTEITAAKDQGAALLQHHTDMLLVEAHQRAGSPPECYHDVFAYDLFGSRETVVTCTPTPMAA